MSSFETRGRILVVDDNQINRRLLQRALETEGYEVTTTEDGRQALDRLQDTSVPSFDVVLLDILMPELDGYATLAAIKGNDALRHLPVIMISAVDELESVIRCIETGATDYLPKPFNPSVLRARLNASLAGKRLRDLELEYLEQVDRVIAAAVAVEVGEYQAERLDGVANRTDALGHLARVFQRMANEVRAREERLKQQVQELRIEIDEGRQAQKVAEITETEFFQRLRSQAEDLRKIIEPN